MSPIQGLQLVSVAVIPCQTAAANITGSAIDLEDFEGIIEVVHSTGAMTGYSVPRLETSVDGSTNWTALTGGGFSAASSQLNRLQFRVDDIPRYIRFTATVATGPAPVSVTLHGFKKYRNTVSVAGTTASNATLTTATGNWNTYGVAVGQAVSGPGIPNGTFVIAGAGATTTLTMSQAATITGSGTFYFQP